MEMYMDDKTSKMLFKKGSRRSPASAAGEGSPAAAGLKAAGRAFSRATAAGRLASLVREQRARFYIMRRCVTMLVCWRD